MPHTISDALEKIYPEPEVVRAMDTVSPGARESDGPRLTGAVRKLKTDKGYGFIAGDDGTDYFFHWSAVSPGEPKGLREMIIQERVDFIAKPGRNGQLRAILVRLIK